MGHTRRASHGLAVCAVVFGFAWLSAGCEKKVKCPPGEVQYNDHCLKPSGQVTAGGDAAAAGSGGSLEGVAGMSPAPDAMSTSGVAGAEAADGGSNSGAAGSSVDGMSGMTGCPSSSELCDGQDNDCDGMADEALTRPCGPPWRGQCRSGTESCVDGAWTACEGAVEAKPEVCDAELTDENCDGATNEGCSCAAGDQKPCPKSEGLCNPGRQLCVDGTWGACVDAGAMTVELCDPVRKDEDCDGMANEGCECTEGETDRCDTGRSGVCGSGVKMCASGKWGTCVATGAAGVEVCDEEMLDEDCDGMANEGCCDDGATRDCMTTRQGACRAGQQACSDGRWGACEGEAPEDEACDGVDNDCNGQVDDGEACPDGQRCIAGIGAGIGLDAMPRCAGCTRATESQDCPNDDPCQRNRCGASGVCEAERRPDGTVCETSSGQAGTCAAGVCGNDGEVVCYVHGDNPSDRTEPTGVRFQQSLLAFEACAADGACNTWFGACETQVSRMPVEWEIFGDNHADVIGPTRSIAALAVDATAARENPLEARKWFGNPRTRDGRAVDCQLYNDGDRVVGGRYREFHVTAPDRVCASDGMCGKWLGRCRVMD